MKKIVLIAGAVFCFMNIIHANPIDPMTLPLISEVYVQSPTNWYIELQTVGLDYPCISSKYHLKIASLKESFNLKLNVDSTGIAVVTPHSIIGFPRFEDDEILLQSYDTLTILDSSTNYPRIWKFPIRPVPEGYSLHNETTVNRVGDCPNPLETNRVTIGVLGNPPIEYESPFISEVLITNNKSWAIELDALYPNILYKDLRGSTTLRFRMKFADSTTIYSVKASFDTNGIAVLKPGDIFTSSGALKILPYPSVVKLLDSCWNNTYHSGLYWDFSIPQTVDSVHSFLNKGSSKTVRTSIGIRATPTTQYNIKFIDNVKNPISNIYVYNSTANYLVFNKKESGSSTNIVFDYGCPAQWYGFTIYPLPPGDRITRTNFVGTSWEGQYIDSLPEITDTLIIPIIPVNNIVSQNLQFNYKFFHVLPVRHQSLFTVVLQKNTSDANVKVLTLDGKLITTLPFGPILSPGTYTCTWNHEKTSPSGTYLCVLSIDGVEVQTLKATIW